MEIIKRKLLSRLGIICFLFLSRGVQAQPTSGWTEVAYTVHAQTPYDLPQSDRYSYVDSVHDFWVYATDKPHAAISKTKPRSEIRIEGGEYTTSGRHQFEGDFYIPSGTSGTSIMQIFGGGDGHATSFMLRVYNDTLKRYNEEAIMTNIYDRWFHLNVVHNAVTGEINVYIDGVLKLTCQEWGKDHHYFKCGVYNQNNPSEKNECKWKNIRIWERSNE